MKELLAKQLRTYIFENNPDLWTDLQTEGRQEDYLKEAIDNVDVLLDQLVEEDHPPYIIRELCMEELTRPLAPSRYTYVKSILETKYPTQYETLQKAGIFVTEVANIVLICQPIFEVFNFFDDKEDDDYLSECIAAAIRGYFNTDWQLAGRVNGSSKTV